MSERIELLYPIEVDGKKTTEVTLRRIKVSDLNAARKGRDDHEQNKIILTRIAELTPAEVEELDASDWTQLCDQIITFLEPPQTENQSGA